MLDHWEDHLEKVIDEECERRLLPQKLKLARRVIEQLFDALDREVRKESA